MGVAVTPGASFAASAPHVLHEGRYLPSINGNTSYDVTADGSRFIRIQQIVPDRALTRIELVLNFLRELE